MHQNIDVLHILVFLIMYSEYGNETGRADAVYDICMKWILGFTEGYWEAIKECINSNSNMLC